MKLCFTVWAKPICGEERWGLAQEYPVGKPATKSGLHKGGEEGWDKRVRHKHKHLTSKESPHLDLQSAMARGGGSQPRIKDKEWVR